MKPIHLFILILVLCAHTFSATAGDGGKPVHLFILSGQSNMQRMKPEESFVPALKKAFPEAECLVVKEAQGGKPIRCWYKNSPQPSYGQPNQQAIPNGGIYDTLMQKVRSATGDKKPTTVTFLWMQGEADSRGDAAAYEEALRGILAQLETDLDRKDVNFVIGRLNTFGNTDSWNALRDVQVKVAESSPRGAWVDTDDLDGEKVDLHHTPEGYRKLGERFAEKAVALVEASMGKK